MKVLHKNWHPTFTNQHCAKHPTILLHYPGRRICSTSVLKICSLDDLPSIYNVWSPVTICGIILLHYPGRRICSTSVPLQTFSTCWGTPRKKWSICISLILLGGKCFQICKGILNTDVLFNKCPTPDIEHLLRNATEKGICLVPPSTLQWSMCIINFNLFYSIGGHWFSNL